MEKEQEEDEAGTMDGVSKLQRTLASFGSSLASVLEGMQRVHQPEMAPVPSEPKDVADPQNYYARYWQERKQRDPFHTRGFHDAEKSAAEDRSWIAGEEAEEVMGLVKAVRESASLALVARTEEEQLAELKQLHEENVKAGEDLEAAVQEANEFLEKVAALQRQVATGALEF